MALPETRTYLLRVARESEFECLLCNNRITGREQMVEHLETNVCKPAGEEGSLIELQRHLMLQNVKWRISFLKWQHFREVIRDNKVQEFLATYLDHCRSCKSFAEHKAGGCETRPRRGLIVSHLAKEAYEHYYAWASAEYDINEMAANKAYEERIEATSFSDLIYMADELWPEMRAAERAAMKRFEDMVARFRKEIMNIFHSEQRLFARLDAGAPLLQQLPARINVAAARAGARQQRPGRRPHN